MDFGKDFLWGAATAAYQIEGAAYEGDKGLNIWDTYCRRKGKVWEGATGDVACDHYHRFREDVQLMADLHLKAYRFSISWARLMPLGTGKVNPDGVRFYNELIDALLEKGIVPFITLYHWDLPQALQERGGWLNPESPAWFAEYARTVVQQFGDRVTHYITFNEPQVFFSGYCNEHFAPGGCYSPTELFPIAHNILKAHGAAVAAMRTAAKQPLQIGYSPTGSMHYPATETPENIEAARQQFFSVNPNADDWGWNVSWWSDPIILGSYPDYALKAFEQYLPNLKPADMELIHQPIDFLGQNIYQGCPIEKGDPWPKFIPYPTGFAHTTCGNPLTPECLYWGMRFLYERYKLPLYVTENGMSNTDWVALDGKVHDPQRIDYLNRYLLQLGRAVEEGIPVKGYFQWSLLDNFEWTRGYQERYGLVYVDYQTLERIPKDSFDWYRRVIDSNGGIL